MSESAEIDGLSFILRRAARMHLGLNEGDRWPSEIADAQAEAVIAAGYTIPPGPTACEHGVFVSHWVGRDGDTPERECVTEGGGRA